MEDCPFSIALVEKKCWRKVILSTRYSATDVNRTKTQWDFQGHQNKTNEKDRKKITGTETRRWSERKRQSPPNPRSVNVHKISDFLLVSIS